VRAAAGGKEGEGADPGIPILKQAKSEYPKLQVNDG